ncbi:transposase [Marispirochaeta sp.]|uniref:transposase n=1 Tax=Marispirochaeta sp. TaxID=2038653 RepID=UPI0029C7B877|nr:transposase [Marispirochaeta sp.]
MPRYKQRSQKNILAPINLSEQLLPGTFEFTLNELIDNQINLDSFDRFYTNDGKGPKAYEPAVLLKVILYAYSKGILSSRQIEHTCKANIIFMTLSSESTPDHSTIAAFVSNRSEDIKMIFTQVLKICYQLDLVGLEYFAIDGCKHHQMPLKRNPVHSEILRKKSKNSISESMI